jgi:NAD kinase
MLPRCVLVERPTEYQELLKRHGTRQQAAFYLSQRGMTIDEVHARHETERRHHAGVMGAIPAEWRRTSITRSDLDRFLFEPADIVLVLGQDGLVANVAKYLTGQPVIGLNPHPGRYPGTLVNHQPAAAGDLFADLAADRAVVQRRTMVQATLDDGQTLVALNEVYLGHASHQSARYQLVHDNQTENQSSSGLIVATGTGATGWAASLHLEHHSTLTLPTPEQPELAFFVREPWPSPTTGTSLTEGTLTRGQQLVITNQRPEGTVLFGDGIEADRLHLDWGQRACIEIAHQQLHLLA